MLFSSTIFLFAFLPIVLASYFLLRGVRARNGLLLFASLFFYAWGEMTYVGLLLGSICLNFILGLALDRSATRARSQVTLVVGVGANLALLGAFKYANFVVDNVNVLLEQAGAAPVLLDPVHLPIGISFFTFQAITYLVDVRRGEAQVQRNPLRVALYIALFPQLIAGPIVRYREIAAQLAARSTTWDDLSAGSTRFVIGLGKKVLIANTLAVPADLAFGAAPGALSIELAWLGAICFALQIYFDFSGYSDMAIGLGRIFGFRFPENFSHPYVARSVREFWRRWHISLSTWFRDYVYVPLGGSRRGAGRTHLNLLIVFLLCGFWHGASWNFVVWGLLHGGFMVVERHGLGGALERLGQPVQHVVTLGLVGLAWVFFRAETLPDAFGFLRALSGGSVGDGSASFASVATPQVWIALALGVLGSTPWLRGLGEWMEARLRDAPKGVYSLADASLSALRVVALQAVLTLCAMSLAAGTHNPFIYFRF